MTRKTLDLTGLDEPERRNPHQSITPDAGGWSRREAPQESQFTIRARIDTIERFKKMCRPPGGGRFTYGEMLERLMDAAENKNG